MKRLQFSHPRRNRKGNAISEFGPALFFFVLCLFFPAINLLGLGAVYFSCYVLNDLQLNQARLVTAEVARSESGPVQGIQRKWSECGLGQFVDPVEPPNTVITYKDGETYDDGKKDVYVVVSTSVKCRPFVTMPIFGEVPGLGAPMTFTFAKEGFCEHPGLTGSNSG